MNKVQRILECVRTNTQNIMNDAFFYDSDYVDPINNLSEYVKDETDAIDLSSEFFYLSNWYLFKFEYESLLKGINAWNTFGQYVLYLEWNFRFEFALGQIEREESPMVMAELAALISSLFIVDWSEELKKSGDIAMYALRTDHLEGGNSTSLHSWFVFELYCRSQGMILDKEGLSYPDSLGIYQKTLNYWDTPDIKLVDQLVSELCEYHINHSSEKDDYEFQDWTYFVFPYEILGWLSLRKKMSLPNPETYSHELMRLSINRLPTEPIQKPKDELLNQVVEKFEKDYPTAKLTLNRIF